jgi:8-oxo-dGTP pyrophosphatase MutT (NUDIX family)
MEHVEETLYNVGVKAAIKNPQGELLVLNITRPNGSATYWDLPGGRVKDGETPEQTLVREVLEETGIDDLEIKDHLGMSIGGVQLPSPVGKYVRVIFSVYTGTTAAPKADPEERIALHWCSVAEAAEYLRSNPDWPTDIVDWIRNL